MKRSWYSKLRAIGRVAACALLPAQISSAQDPGAAIPSSGNPYGPRYGVVPSAPNQPTNASRPAGWPGSAPVIPATANLPTSDARGAADARQAAPSAEPAPRSSVGGIQPGRQFDSADILARIGLTEVIQAGEILPAVNDQLTRALHAQKGTEIPQEEIDAARLVLMKQKLNSLIETKLLMAEVRRKVPAENLTKVEEKVKEQFNKQQLPKMMEQTKATSRADLQAKMRKAGTSIESMQRAYFERQMAAQWLHDQVKEDQEITHADMLAFYRDHAAEFETQARARWEHLMARFDKFGSKAEAYRAIADWGNRVLGGAPLAEVAKAHSHDISSIDGGVHDWTTQGSLVSASLDQAVFGLPVGKLSQIIEDDRGFHILRVIERDDLERKPFLDAQVEIKKKIKEERMQAQMKEFLEKLREKTPVWTVFDETAAAVN